MSDDGYAVDVDALYRAAAAARAAGEYAPGVDLTTSVDKEIQGALPGSRSAYAASDLGDRWRTQITSWSNEALAYAENMSACADAYCSAEDAAVRTLSPDRVIPEERL